MHEPSETYGPDGPDYNASAVDGSYWPPTSLSSAPSTAAPGFPSQSPVFRADPRAHMSFSTYLPSMVPSGLTTPDQRLAPRDTGGNNKVAIPRLAAPTTYRGKRRSARACEPCRQRKIKCDGVRPMCGQCAYHNTRCMYEDVKRVRDQKRLELLSKRTERYESLLRDLESEVDAPTARRIRKALKSHFKYNPGKPKHVFMSDLYFCGTRFLTKIHSVSQVTEKNHSARHDDPEDSDSSSSVGSLEAVDQVDEDLNRNERTRAAGFFGKNSEVSWMQRLEDDIEQKASRSGSHLQSASGSSAAVSQAQSPRALSELLPTLERLDRDIPIALMNYHLDDLDIPVVSYDSDPFAVPPREIADKYFDAYMTYVHPTFCVLRKSTFTSQYRQFFTRPTRPPQKWLGILNMVFAIGCRHCKLLDPAAGSAWEDEHELVYLSRARQLSLYENVLFEHTDLQQIQLESLVAIYLLCLGQPNRASKFSGMALRSALSLGINLHITDGRTQDASKEARCRLWWSIYSLEHLLTSMNGRASCVSESLCSVPPPLHLEEEFFDQPEVARLLQDRSFREAQLRPTLFETPSQSQSGSSWMAECEPCPALFFYNLTDLVLISQAVLNKIYSIEGIREGSSEMEHRLKKYSLQMDRWLAKVPPAYQFTVPDAGPWHLDHAKLDDSSAPHARERVCLAMNYYSARVILCRPCLSQSHSQQSSSSSPAQDTGHREKLRAEMATECLQAACSLISILPDNPDIAWFVRTTPWWSVLHFIMQATTALLLALSFKCFPDQTSLPTSSWTSISTPSSASNAKSSGKSASATASVSASDHALSSAFALLDADLDTVISQSKKGLLSIHALAAVDPSARRAFLFCHGVMRKLAPALKIDLTDWPSVDSLVGGGGVKEQGGRMQENQDEPEMVADVGNRMEGLEDLVDFGGDAG